MTEKWIYLLTIILILLLSLYFYLYYLTSQFDEVNPSSESREAGIILGAALWDGELSPALKERCDLGLSLYRSGLVKYLVLSGGLGNDQHTEAKAMFEYLQKQGLPKNRLILEDNSRNTWENLRNTKQLLQQYHLKKVTIITHDYHLYRALRIAHQLQIDAKPSPVHSTVMFMPYYKTKESLSLIKQYLMEYMRS
ncbi:YdcF family protein [Seinonella peptonophila]|uniref:YdcF family protein n=1 Tax=Seinonella peptonophila TaxID=112248 RepID=UPI001587CC3D|nr:YdcF family protein [Seinonella peptonophila]